MTRADLLVAPCSHRAALAAVRSWHYSRSLPTPPLVKYGAWEDGRFIGVVLFGRGMPPMCAPYGVTGNEAAELARVALDVHATPTSRIVAIAVRLLRRQSPRLRLLVSYADMNQDHYGTLYQAAGWTYLGETAAAPRFVDASGRIWHSRQISGTGVKKQYGSMRSCPTPDELTKMVERPKHRYGLGLDDDMRALLRERAQAFPKRA